jgi:hypothetical protein
MTTFRHKNNKSLQVSKNITTLDSVHKKKESQFQEMKNTLPMKKEKLQLLIEEYNKHDAIEYTDKNISDKAKLKDDISQLQDEIKKIENNTDEINYYFNTYDILLDYYDETNNDTNNPMANNILYFFANNKQETLKNNNKASLFDNYNMIIDNTYTNKAKNTNLNRICAKCNIDKILNQNEGLYECTNCGDSDLIIIESTIPSYKESISEPITYSYRRINHQLFNEVINSKLIIIM